MPVSTGALSYGPSHIRRGVGLFRWVRCGADWSHHPGHRGPRNGSQGRGDHVRDNGHPDDRGASDGRYVGAPNSKRWLTLSRFHNNFARHHKPCFKRSGGSGFETGHLFTWFARAGHRRLNDEITSACIEGGRRRT